MADDAAARGGERATYQIRALERGLDILEAFTLNEPELSIGQLSERTSLPKPTIVRLLSVLIDRSYIERNPDSERLRLGVRSLEVGSVFQLTTSVETEAQPIMRRLAERTGQTANLGVLDHEEVVHIAVVAPDRPVRFWASIGKREAAYVSGIGKVLLAGLDEVPLARYLDQSRPTITPHTIAGKAELQAELEHIRAQGYALDNEESNLGVRCVAAPIHDGRGALVAAVSISGAKAEFEEDRLAQYIEDVTGAAREISVRLGARS